MEPLLLYPDPAQPALAQALDLAGYPWKAVGSPDDAARVEPEDGWAGAIVCADVDAEGAFALCRGVRKRDLPLEPLLLLVSGDQLGDLELREDLFDDFCVAPFHPRELEARLKHLFWRTGRGTRPELIEDGGEQHPAAQQDRREGQHHQHDDDDRPGHRRIMPNTPTPRPPRPRRGGAPRRRRPTGPGGARRTPRCRPRSSR